MQNTVSNRLTGPARNLIAAVVILCLLVTVGWVTLHSISKAHAASTVTVNGASTFQTIDGFGFSESFGRAASMNSAPASAQKQMLDYLFSPTAGAGFTILRNIINTDSTGIEPNSPGSPSSPPTYVWDGSDSSQVWLSKQAQSYGVSQIYADAWSAPGFMKTNNSNINGGT